MAPRRAVPDSAHATMKSSSPLQRFRAVRSSALASVLARMARHARGAALVALACVGPCAVSGLAASFDAETVANFKKYFKTYKEPAARVEAVLALENMPEPEVVELLVPVLKDPDADLVRAAIRVLATCKEPLQVAELKTVLEKDKNEAVRVGVLRALSESKAEGASDAAVQLLGDKSWEVRRRALQLLSGAKAIDAAPRIAPLGADPEPAVRAQALDVLAAFKSELVVPKAVACVNDQIWQVRASAFAALRVVRHKDAVEPLVSRMQVEEGRLVPDLAEALANLTGQEHGVDPAKWKAWWEGAKNGYILPTEDAIAYFRTRRAAATGDKKADWSHPRTTVTGYHGIETTSRSILFIIDVSGSMEAEVIEKERFSDGNYPTMQRIDIVKTELMRTIDRLDANVNFNILAFATKVDPWKKDLVASNIVNKSAAKDWIKGLEAIGGNSKEDLASVGLLGAANMEMGKTNTYGALIACLGIDPKQQAKGPVTGAVPDKNYKVGVDTIFFLSDGRPTVGEYVDPEDIRREVRALNELRKVVLHTIAIGEFQKEFMKRIAEENGGVFVDLGR